MTAFFQSTAPLKVLFLSSDTGGGHRASAESLAKQFLIRYPGTKYDILDIWTPCGVKPYCTLIPSYKHLSAHPWQWRILFHLSNTLPWEIAMDLHVDFMCRTFCSDLIESYDPDVIVSVHPAMNYVPIRVAKRLSKKKNKHIPFFTVVTDLGSAHATWFHRRVEKLYLASDRLFRLARRRGLTPVRKIQRVGLPIRYEFELQSKKLGDRTTIEGKQYQRQIRRNVLNLPADALVVLVMGGGEGVGPLSEIVNELYASLSYKGIDATVLVVCGRNEKLRQDLKSRDWEGVLKEYDIASRKERRWRPRRRMRLSSVPSGATPGKVRVVGLGFVSNVAEYMVASDVLVTKAGPGTIAEAASLGLPIFLTSFLPGQEAGNVDYVLENEFGAFCRDPVYIADQVSIWLENPEQLKRLSQKSQQAGFPHAAADIAKDIGSITHTWMKLNQN